MTESFNVVAIDPDGYRFGHFLHYFCRLLAGGLESLGYDCAISRNRLDSGRTTIVIGGHLLGTPAHVDAIVANGPYVVLQTELIDVGARVFWGGTDRFETIYSSLLRGARAVWEVIPRQVATLRAMGVNARLLLGGYEPTVQVVRHKTEKDIDFLFFGSRSPHRANLLQLLSQRGATVIAVFDDPAIFRNDLIARARASIFRFGPAPRRRIFRGVGSARW